jgi:menaquinone-9 beta-reductase
LLQFSPHTEIAKEEIGLKMKYSAVIIGAGPGGLSCATNLAQNGVKTLVIERKETPGPKVCAGGITWSGLISRVPEDLIEASFPKQYIYSKLQEICVSSSSPIIATINRLKFGQFMAKQATDNGVTILTNTTVRSIGDKSLVVYNSQSLKTESIEFEFLIGADGSLSKVRKHLNIPTEHMGIGINYQLPFKRVKMEWHLNTKYFKNGYGWIFPHSNSISIGAYVDKNIMSAKLLKENLVVWAAKQEIDLSKYQCSAEYINYDFRGWDFGKTFLIGDAAGFASALTGEGIYPAIISGETVAEKILNPNCNTSEIDDMIIKQKRFQKMVEVTGRSKLHSSILAELGLLMLRSKILDFRYLEMA